MAITSEIKLSAYNGALRRLGSRKLSSLDENREPRRVLDDIWGAGDEVVRYALERGEWNFAIRAVEGIYASEIETTFGYRRAFTKPDDFVRLASLSGDPYFRLPLTDDEYSDEATYWLADHDVIYIRYVSDADTFGFNASAWSEGFKDYLQCHLAWEACERLTNSTDLKRDLKRERDDSLREAKSSDAMNEGTKFRPPGSWIQSRHFGRNERSRIR